MRLHLVIGSLESSQAGADGTVIWGAAASPNSTRSWQRPECSPAWETGPPAVASFPIAFLSYFSFPPFVLPHPATDQVLTITRGLHLPKPQFPHLESGNNNIVLQCLARSDCLISVSYCIKLRLIYQGAKYMSVFLPFPLSSM